MRGIKRLSEQHTFDKKFEHMLTAKMIGKMVDFQDLVINLIEASRNHEKSTDSIVF